MLQVPSGVDPTAIGRRIVLLREALGLSPADFARLTSLSSQALANYETGYRRPDVDQAMKVVRGTGVTLDYLYLGELSGLSMRIVSMMTARADRDTQERKTA